MDSCFPQMKSFKKFGSKKTTTPSIVSSRRDLKLDDKVAIITGAASGIGAATARLFVSNGAKVLIADVKADAGRKLSSELGSSAHFFHCDVTNEADIAAAVDYAMASWGHLDIMFNNAGVSGPLSGLADINIEEFDQVMAVHIKGAVLGVKHAARVMIPARKGVILFSGSTSATMGGAGPPLYSAANAAVLCIVRSAAAELIPHGIRVNAVSPHCVPTPMSIASFNAAVNLKPGITVEQFEKLLVASSASDGFTAEKVANAVMFLASDEAEFISGHNLVLDGAFSVTKHFDSSDLKAALESSQAAESKAETNSNGEEGLTSPGLGSRASASTKERENEDKPRVKDERAREKEEKAAEKKALAEKGKGLGSRASASTKERENEDKPRVKDERAREKEENAEKKALAEKGKEQQKENKEREKGGKEKQIAEEKARAKAEKALAKEAQAPPKYPKAGLLDKDEEIHPLDKRALAKEERIRNEKIELPNAGPEPDIPTEFQARPPVRRIGSLLSWGRDSLKKERADDMVSNSNGKKSDDKSSDPGQVSTKEKDDKSTDPGKVSKKETMDDKSTDPSKVSRKEKKKDKSTDPGKVSKKEEDQSDSDPGKATEENGRTASNISPTTAASSSKGHQPKAPSPLARIVRLLSPRKEKSRAKDRKVRFSDIEESSPQNGGGSPEMTPASPH